ncbi:MAG: c-type cytochrome biogenesis protein CcmI [Burkholderiales bacterium]|nr:c-type cytochrome biogenesis protein CcmI [Burkholderiales bacterium]
MIAFYAIAALLTVAVLAALLRPLLKPPTVAETPAQVSNAAVYREQLATLDRELAEGAISLAEHQASRDELHLRLLQDEQAADATAPKAAQAPSPAKRSAWALAVVLPLAAAGTYAMLGAPNAINAERAAAAQQHEMEAAIETLAARLKANPDNPKGWAMLARSYKVLGRMEDAEQAYSKVGAMLDADPDLLANYADLIVARTQSFDGRPMTMIRKALAIDPKHPMSLMLLGTAAFQAGRFAEAAAEWEKLLAVVEPNSQDAEELQSAIAEAREKAGMKAHAKAPAVAAAATPIPPALGAAPQQMPPGTPEQMVERLAARLKANPNDPDGWDRLARSYEVLGKAKEAQEARLRAADARKR